MTRSWTLSRFMALGVVVPVLSMAFSLASTAKVNAQAAPAADPDWPCVQRLLPEIAGGMVWAGPPLEEVSAPDEDRAFATLSKELAARRVPIEQAEQQIADYAGSLDGAEKSDTLAALFSSTLGIINDDRASIINGIRKFSRGQRALADKINAKNQEIAAMDRSDILARDTAVAERDWDIR
ncbi:MAG: hypothetical protein ACR2RE_18515, partial [Geminicoccaceae bacterium]